MYTIQKVLLFIVYISSSYKEKNKIVWLKDTKPKISLSGGIPVVTMKIMPNKISHCFTKIYNLGELRSYRKASLAIIA